MTLACKPAVNVLLQSYLIPSTGYFLMTFPFCCHYEHLYSPNQATSQTETDYHRLGGSPNLLYKPMR